MIGLFNIVGSLASGWLGELMPKRYILSFIYFGRALADRSPSSRSRSRRCRRDLRRRHGPALAVDGAADHGIVALMFGTRWLAMLVRLRLLQPSGRRLPRRLARRRRVRGDRLLRRGLVAVGLCSALLSAVINLPIVEKPVAAPAAAASHVHEDQRLHPSSRPLSHDVLAHARWSSWCAVA